MFPTFSTDSQVTCEVSKVKKLICVSSLVIVFPSFISKLCLSNWELKCHFPIFRMVLYFCPACGGLLSVQMGREVQRLECRTCPYIHNILERGFSTGLNKSLKSSVWNSSQTPFFHLLCWRFALSWISNGTVRRDLL